MTFLSPWSLLLGLAVLAPLAGVGAHERRVRQVCRVLAVPAPRLRRLTPVVLALLAACALLALAVAEPVRRTSHDRLERSGVEVEVVLDVSGSMLAAASRDGATRLERAEAAALRLRDAFPAVRFGIATLTDRTLPIVFPTGDRAVFALALRQSVGIERPPPSIAATRATALGSLATLGPGNFFAAPRRVAVVFTDGESEPVPASAGAALRRAGIHVLLVHVWRPGERVHLGGLPDPSYRADPASGAALRRAAAVLGGRGLEEADAGGLASAVRAAVGTGGAASAVRARDVRQDPLARWFVLGAALPVAFLLLRLDIPAELLRGRWGRRAGRPARML